MDKYTRIHLKLKKVYEMKKVISDCPNMMYNRYRDHKIAYSKIRRIIRNNADFILNAIVKDYESDGVKIISQMKVASFCFSNNLFLHLLASCSIANRLSKACKKNDMPPELVDRIRDCMVVFLE